MQQTPVATTQNLSMGKDAEALTSDAQIMKLAYQERIRGVAGLLKDLNLDAFVLYAEGGRKTDPYHSWLCGVHCTTEDGLVLMITRDGAVTFIDVPWAAAELRVRLDKVGLSGEIISAPTGGAVREKFREISASMRGVAYAGSLPIRMCSGPMERYYFLDSIDELMVRKNPVEIRWITQGAQEISHILRSTLNSLTPGMTQADIASRVLQGIHQVEGIPAFEPIRVVSGGKLSRTTGHPIAGKCLEPGDAVCVDAGHINKQRIFSDITRMAFLGDNPAREEYGHLSSIVERLTPYLKPGIRVREILDRFVQMLRDEQFHYESLCVPELGHGIGYKLHESPNIGTPCDLESALVENSVICFEPDIITNHSAIRIEQEILITASGGVVISKADK